MKVKLTYFKPSGKYYSEGQYESTRIELFHIWDEVEGMNRTGNLPGLVESSRGWIILVDVPDHPYNHPKLIISRG